MVSEKNLRPNSNKLDCSSWIECNPSCSTIIFCPFPFEISSSFASSVSSLLAGTGFTICFCSRRQRSQHLSKSTLFPRSQHLQHQHVRSRTCCASLG
ncbi:hypothetical protein AVEN_73194-1 [Araneus ventricosus]|uniref:Uncharacterized protein n=1 Tax=Araneus ventricosus TaxID=182803 RepID=A0A4Y2K9X9_ARAVE|nr:hypothetical protein AVEN_73194-1 [Araneus ventricosus]